MVQVVKSEWHQVEKRYDYEVDEILLSEIYPNLTEEEIAQLLEGLETGETSIEDVINDAWEEGVDIDWNYMDEDDWWTDRKGGYEVTYEVSK
jgi:hypothetical protein